MISALIYFGIIFLSNIQSVCTKLFHRENQKSEIFNARKSVSAFLLFGVFSISQFSFHMPTLLLGMCYGLSLSVSMFAGYKALCTGPMALTGMLVSFSVILPLLWGVLVRQELITGMQYPAFVLLFASIIILNVGKLRKKDADRKHSVRWLFYTGVTLLCNGVCSILQKEHQSAFPGQYNMMFMTYAMLVCSIVYLGIILTRMSKKEFLCAKGKMYSVLAGITNAAANYLTLRLAGFENASVLFPIVSAGTIFGALISGRLIFGEKIRFDQLTALIIGIVAIVLLKL